MSFRLIKAEVKPLTPQLAEEFRNLPASPTEREINPSRIKHLREKAEAGQLVTFHWSTALLDGEKLRMNGQHSSTMLCDLNGQFPDGLKVHLDEYEVSDKNSLATLFRQFDDRKSGRTPTDVAGAYQGLFEELKDVPKASAKLGAEGIVWYRRTVEGIGDTRSGDDAYQLFGEPGTHKFLNWLGELFSIKTPELKKVPVVAAIYGTFCQNEEQARTFWQEVARGGVEYEDNAPATVLDAWLKEIAENKKKTDIKAGNFYQACAYAWNAYRDGRAIQSIKYDTKKGLISLTA